MTRLLVFRGETLVQELDLARLPVTIGRGPANDLVLDDPVKSVSREHAEIRLERDRYVLVDRQSENGIWSAGRRLPSIPFDADTVAVIGPFRLKMEGLPSSASDAPAPGAAGRAMWRPAVLARLSPSQQRIAAGAAALLVAVGTLAVAGVVRSTRERERAASEVAAAMLAANQQLAQGACADALTLTIQPALAKAPDHGGLLDLRQRAEACLAPPPPPPEPPLPSAADVAVAAVRDAMAGGQCDAALLQQITAVLTAVPDHADALALKTEAEACLARAVKPVTPGVKPPVLARRIPPEEGGLEPVAGELDLNYQTRLRAMRQRYDEALSAAARGASRTVVETFEAIAREATPQYLEVSTHLAAARRAYAQAGQQRLAEARALAQKRQWNEALQKYAEAREIDPAAPVDAEIRKVQDDKRQAGLAVCRSARQRATYAPAEAPALYRQVLDLLPADDPCYLEAQRALTPR